MISLTKSNRIATMMVDHFIMCFLLMLLEAPFMIKVIASSPVNNGRILNGLSGHYWYDIFVFSLYFNKDILQGRSIAKRVFKFQVVDFKTGKSANPIKCLIRNLTILVWPIEVIMALINTERRLGDFIAGTKLTVYSPAQVPSRPNYLLVAVAVPISMFFTYTLWFYPFELLIRHAS